MRSLIPVLIFSIFVSIFSSGVATTAMAQSSGDLSLHYIDGKPQTGAFAYDVSVYFSAFQPDGNTLSGLQVSDLVLSEDGKTVAINELGLTVQDPINIAIVIDTSGSMAGPKIDSAKRAASSLATSFRNNDQVAILSFNTKIKTEVGFTNDTNALQKAISSLNAERGSGTCFYDALYSAAQLTATLPPGRRALIVLTDGVDELPNGAPCSKYLNDDVLSLAAHGITRVPIYTIGLGNHVDSSALDRLSKLTGGQFQFTSDESKLQDLFQRIGEQLRSEYRATYTSTAAPGPHTLILQIKTKDQQLQDSRDFVLPNFPYRLIFISPKAGESITGKTRFQVQVLGQGDPIQKVDFLVNDKSVGSAETLPYELEWQAPADMKDAQKIEAILIGATGKELARATQIISIERPASQQNTVDTRSDVAKKQMTTLPTIAIFALGILGVAVLAVVIILVTRLSNRRKPIESVPVEYLNTYVGDQILDGVSVPQKETSRNSDNHRNHSGVLGTLVLLESNDPAMIGQQIEITKPTITLGRKADNDIIFPKDSTVSRHHAVIELRNEGLFLKEITSLDDKGEIQGSSFGTFVNDQKLQDSVLLKSGDQIRLGKRVSLRFVTKSDDSENEATVDDLSLNDMNKTIEED